MKEARIILSYSIAWHLREDQVMRPNSMRAWGGLGVEGGDYRGQQGTFWGDENILFPDYGGDYTTISFCQNS